MKKIKEISIATMLLSCCLTSYAQVAKYDIRLDGSFDIAGTTIKIANCYPALNNSSIKPIKVNITATKSSKTIQYVLLNGVVELTFSYQDKALIITPTLKGKSLNPNMISILRDAEVFGAEKVYRTSTQILGNGGVKVWPADNWDYSSCGGLTGLVPDSGFTVVISTRNFKKFMSYTNAYPTGKNGGRKLIDVCVATEGLPPTDLPSFYFTENAVAYEAMQSEAKAIATFMEAKNDKKQSYHWCSWYYAYYHLTENMLSEYLKGFETLSPRVLIILEVNFTNGNLFSFGAQPSKLCHIPQMLFDIIISVPQANIMRFCTIHYSVRYISCMRIRLHFGVASYIPKNLTCTPLSRCQNGEVGNLHMGWATDGIKYSIGYILGCQWRHSFIYFGSTFFISLKSHH